MTRTVDGPMPFRSCNCASVAVLTSTAAQAPQTGTSRANSTTIFFSMRTLHEQVRICASHTPGKACETTERVLNVTRRVRRLQLADQPMYVTLDALLHRQERCGVAARSQVLRIGLSETLILAAQRVRKGDVFDQPLLDQRLERQRLFAPGRSQGIDHTLGDIVERLSTARA